MSFQWVSEQKDNDFEKTIDTWKQWMAHINGQILFLIYSAQAAMIMIFITSW